ncbi:tRNA pseudouridine(13) synthase TruD [Bowmanella dokdonensis]|uniref:tRNA pseudouridine(13) synthase TruD n=1 Tax=Bowmanella dokdonensis TaxID=751969 RepID=UPI003F6B44F2
METGHWAYLLGKPVSQGVMKQQPEDFIVREKLGFEPCGEGEHLFLWIRKTGLNTAWLAEQLARFAGVHPRNVSFSGRKDKHAVTEQWIGLHLPGKQDPDWSAFQVPGAEILRAVRHNKKLRTGTHKANQFELTLKGLSAPDSVVERLNHLSDGVPNYFGEQRFGMNDGNLRLGERMLGGEIIRDRQKRSMCISALRSWLFNEVINRRLRGSCFSQPLAGDIMILRGSQSYFCADEPDSTLISRLAERDIMISAPLWGKGDLATKGQALALEQSVALEFPELIQGLEQLGLEQDRRSLVQYPCELEWQLNGDTLKLSFELPSGGFATSVTRELIQTENHPAEGN